MKKKRAKKVEKWQTHLLRRVRAVAAVLLVLLLGWRVALLLAVAVALLAAVVVVARHGWSCARAGV